MAQEVIIRAGYTSRTSKDYQSEEHSIQIEVPSKINGSTQEIESASDRLFRLCKKIVEQQKQDVSVDSLLSDPQPQPQQLPPPQDTTFNPPADYSRNSNTGQQCSEKQVKCIFGVAKSRGMVNGAIQGLAQRFGKQRLEELTSQEASALIKELKQ